MSRSNDRKRLRKQPLGVLAGILPVVAFAIIPRHGRGCVVAFTPDPNVRVYLDGLNVIFMNAIFRGAAHARPLR